MANYFKLGPKASSFTDPVSGIKLGPGEVIKLARTPNNRLFISRLKGKAIVGATEQEYNQYTGLELTPEPEPPEESLYLFVKEELESLTISEILDDAEDQEVPADVIKSLKKMTKAEMIKTLVNL